MINQSESVFRKILTDVSNGNKVSPRGQLVLEIENYNYTLPPRVKFCNFEARKLNEDYIKREFLWYLRGIPDDHEITNHATMWQSLINDDNEINSNYGQYIFKPNEIRGLSQFDAVVKLLGTDKDSRRASMVILSRYHTVELDSKDVPCTYALNFRIRDNKLKMTVHMRSQDAIFGMGNDAPCFSLIHEMVYVSVRDLYYPDLEMGEYHHFADSFHVYERHFTMLDSIVSGSNYVDIDCPQIKNVNEVEFLKSWIHSIDYGFTEHYLFRGRYNNLEADSFIKNLVKDQLSNYEFSSWLLTFKGKQK
jgi:thymidylate synthase